MWTFTCRTLDGTAEEVEVQSDSSTALLHAIHARFGDVGDATFGVVGLSGGKPVRVNEGDTLTDLAMTGELTILKRHTPLQEERDEAKVTQAVIEEQTKHLTDNGQLGMSTAPRTSEENRALHLFSILNSLLTICRTVQGAIDPDTLNQPDDMDDTEDEPVNPASTVDQDSLRALTSMGFGENRCVRALLACRNNLDIAMEWLLTHSEDTSHDRPLTPLPSVQRSKTGVKFHPDRQAFQQLKDMGFEEPQVLAALQLTHNGFEQACDLLLSGQDVVSTLEQQEKMATDSQSPIMKRVLDDAKVQASFSEPRIRQALEAMVRDPNSAVVWLQDPVVGPVLVHVSHLLSLDQEPAGAEPEDLEDMLEYDSEDDMMDEM